jgi:DNA-binding XRE family transcriptional regulator
VLDETTKLLGAMLLEMLEETNEAQNLHNWIWQHLIAETLAELEAEHGVEAIAAMAEEPFLKMLNKQLFEKQDVGAAAANLLAIRGQDLGRYCLETLDLPNRSLQELCELLGLESNTADTDLKGTMQVRIAEPIDSPIMRTPNNPLMQAGLKAISAGGRLARVLQGGWRDPGHGVPVYRHLGSKKGEVVVYPQKRTGPEEALPTTETLWAFVESLNLFTADVALAVLAQMVAPSTGDRPKYPLLEPVKITAGAILQYKGIQRYGAERRLLEQRIAEEMERLRALTFDVHQWPTHNPENPKKWAPEGASWQGDHLFDIVKVEKWQESLIDGEPQRIEVAWSVRAGQWAYWWMNSQGRVWLAHMARVLLELDHRKNRPVAAMAKGLGVQLAFWVGPRTIERRIEGLLQDIGELPIPEERNHKWGGRTRERFDAAFLVLKEGGVIADVAWPEGYGPGEGGRSKGWVDQWLGAKVRITLPELAEELPAPTAQPALPKPAQRKRRKPVKVQQIDGNAVRRAREARGCTQDDLAAFLGVTQPYIARIENGKRLPGVALAKKLRAWIDGIE